MVSGVEKMKKKLQIFFSKIFIFGHGIGTFRFFLTPLQNNGKNLFSTFLRCFNGFGWGKNKKKIFENFHFWAQHRHF